MKHLAPLLLLAACSSPGTSFYGDDDMPINNGGGDGGACTVTSMTVTAVHPLIQIVVDGSGSMTQQNIMGSGTSKLGAIKNALYDNGGTLLATYQDNAQFGATAYTTNNCPVSISDTDCALNNLANVKDKIADANYPGQDPLASALGKVADTDFAKTSTDPHRAVVLVTDGVPNVCNNTGVDDTTASVTATTALYTLGVKTYVIGLEPHDGVGNDTTYADFLKGVADAGVGGAGTVNKGDSQANLTAAFKTVFDQLIDCSFTVDGTIDVNNASTGMVTYDGASLAYTTDWTVVDPHTIRLSAAKCDTYKAAATLPVIAASLCGT